MATCNLNPKESSEVEIYTRGEREGSEMSWKWKKRGSKTGSVYESSD